LGVFSSDFGVDVMPRETVEADSIIYVIAPEDPLPAGLCPSLLAGVRVLDELTGQPPSGAITLTPSLANSSARVAEGGLVGLVGIPLRAFPALATTGYTAGFLVNSAGFVPRAVSVAVPVNPAFPASFAAPPVNDLPLHRLPTVIRGRVFQVVMGQSVAVPNASVAVTGIWPTPPPAAVSVPASPPNLVSLAPTLYFDRASGGQLIPIVLTPVSGEDKILLAAVSAGTNLMRLSDSRGLSVGDILLVDPEDPQQAEYLPIQTIQAGSTADQPASYTFTYALTLPHRRGAVARKVTPGAAGPAKTITQDAWVGDTWVFLSDVAGLSPSQQVQIGGGTAPVEYHAAAMFATQSDPGGYYQFPPLSRVAQVAVAALQGALHAKPEFQPDYSIVENVLDLQMTT
jgi:hypothetical protein